MRSRRLATISIAPAAVACVLLLAGCGGGGSGSADTSTSGGATASQTLAYTHCMRSHGVATFPDPTSGGEIPKTQVVTARKSNPSQFDSADSACHHLLPSNGNGATPAEIAQDWAQFRQFAQCMRHHGVPNWPDPTARSSTDKRPAFLITAVGLNGNSPQLRAKAHQCASSVHITGLPAAG